MADGENKQNGGDGLDGNKKSAKKGKKGKTADPAQVCGFMSLVWIRIRVFFCFLDGVRISDTDPDLGSENQPKSWKTRIKIDEIIISYFKNIKYTYV